MHWIGRVFAVLADWRLLKCNGWVAFGHGEVQQFVTINAVMT
jgi:hypothetical protein